MSHSLIIRERAVSEIEKAFEYYEMQKSGLGDRYLATLHANLEYIVNHPKHVKVVRKSFRQALMDVFPFVIIYKIDKKYIVVFSVFHTSRNPKQKYK